MEKTFKITASEGLHARPATLLVSAVNPLDAEVRLGHNGKPANLKSIMAVKAARIPRGAEVTITAEGAGGQQAIEKESEVFVSQNIGADN